MLNRDKINDDEAIVNLDDLSVFNHTGERRVKLDGGNYKPIFFAYQLIDRWLTYSECHKCGRGEYCKFSVAKDGSRNQDTLCGVVQSMIINFTKYTWKLFNELSREEKQNYLDGLFHLQRYVFHSEQLTGLFLDSASLEGLEKYAPSLFGKAVSLCRDLNKVAEYFKNLKEFNANRNILFVEGWSEKLFVESVLKGGLFWFRRFEVEVYGGKHNKSPKKLQLLIEKLKKEGYEIYIQGDQDGKRVDIFQEHNRKKLVPKPNTFQFKHDLESVLPQKLMFEVLTELELVNGISFQKFSKSIYPCEESVITKIKRELSIDISSHKLDIANIAGELIAESNWWFDDEIKNSELGEFLNFLTKY